MKAQIKTSRLYVAAACLLLLALLVFVQQAFNLNPFVNPSVPSEIVLLYTLSAFIFLALVIFGFVLARILVKLWIERKQQKPGSKFKTSIVVTLIALTLVPAFSLFAFAFGLVNRSIDKWFSVPVDQVFDASRRINEQWRMEHEAEIRGIVGYLAENPPASLEAARRQFRMKALLRLDNSGQVVESSLESGVTADEVLHAVLAHAPGSDGTYVDAGSYWVGSHRIGNDAGLIVAAFPAPEEIRSLTATISEQHAYYGELVQSRSSYRDTLVYILILMTVLVLFAAVWVGLFLSKRITVPIEALAEATREISAGNLNHRVNIEAGDELGMLVKLFNDMAGRLQGTTTELETRRRFMEVILESIPTGVIAVDTDLNVNALNRAARTMFSVQNAATLREIFRDKDLAQIAGLVEEAGEGSITREVAFVTPGRPTHSAVTVSRLQTGGFMLVVEDLTEVARAQKATAWREVARRLAHEIKNPLTPIQLSAERIARNISRLPGATPRVSTVVQECVDAIVDEVSSLKNLVDEFVRFARLPTVARVPTPMRELVDKTMALYEGRLEGVSVAVTVPDELPLILMDPLQMKRVLINLIDNALEALSGEPVRELAISCELARDGTMARLVIEDTGRGIAPEDRERLFAPYFSTRKNGTGLGLAIASRIISDHGGYIGAESNWPRGTRFVIELPVCQESSLSTTSQVSGSL